MQVLCSDKSVLVNGTTVYLKNLAQQAQSPNSNSIPLRVIWENWFHLSTLLTHIQTSESQLRSS